MSRYYYSNPAIGAGISNLADAMFGDPLQDARAGLIGDQRYQTQANTRRLDAQRQLYTEEYLTEESERRRAEENARALEAALLGYFQDPNQGALAAAVAGAPGANPAQRAGGITELYQELFNEDELARRDQRFELEQIGAKNQGDLAVQGLENESAMALQQDQQRRDAIAASQEAIRDRMIEAMQIRGDQQIEQMKLDAEGPSGSGGKTYSVSPSTIKFGNENLADFIGSIYGDDYADAAESVQMDVMRRYSELVSQTRNPQLSLEQAIVEVLGASPELQGTGLFDGDPRISRARPAPAAGGPAPGTVVDGYQFLGGDPNDPASWRQVQ